MYLESFTKNQFMKIRVGNNRREMFVNHHLMHLQASNPNGIYDGIIADTTILHNELAENLALRSYTAGAGKSSTFTVNQIIDECIDISRKLNAMAVIKFDKISSEYLEGFPHGFAEIQNITQAAFKPVAQRTLAFAKKYKTELGQEYVDKLEDILLRWDEKLNKREEVNTNAQTTRPAFETLWNKLCIQLQKNLYTILLANYDNTDVLFTYFDETLVNFRHHTSDDTPDETYKLTIAPNTSKTANISFSPDDTLLIINNGIKPIFYYGAATADEQPKTAPIEIAAGDEAEVTALSLGAPANRFLILQNKDGAETAEVEIALI